MTMLIGGVPVDGAQQGIDQQVLGGRAVDTTGNILPSQRATIQPLSGSNSGGSNSSGVPTLPTPVDFSQSQDGINTATGNTNPADNGQPPLVVPPPTPATPGLDTTGANAPPTDATSQQPNNGLLQQAANQPIGDTNLYNPAIQNAEGVNLDTMTPRTTTMAAPTGPASDVNVPTQGVTPGLSPAAAATGATGQGGQGADLSSILALLSQINGPANPNTDSVASQLSANVTGIDPMNDLRDKQISPATDQLTEQARQNMADAQSNLSNFDRGSTLDDALAKYSANPALTAPVDPGKDVSNLLDTADQSTMNALGKVTGTDRQSLADALTSGYLNQIGPTNVDPGKDVSGQLDQADAATMGDLSKLNATDRQALANQLFSQYQGELGPTAVQAGAAIDATPSDRLKSLQDEVDQATSSLNSVDRVKLAQQMFDTFAQSTDPQ
jgi:hypothetical protein